MCPPRWQEGSGGACAAPPCRNLRGFPTTTGGHLPHAGVTLAICPLPGGVPPLCAEARKRRPGGLAPAWDPRWWSQVTSQHTDPSYRHGMHHSEGARDAGRGPKWVRHKPRKAASGTSHACATGQNHQLLQRTPPVVIVPPYLTPLRKASGEGVPEKVQSGRRSGLLGSIPGL